MIARGIGCFHRNRLPVVGGLAVPLHLKHGLHALVDRIIRIVLVALISASAPTTSLVSVTDKSSSSFVRQRLRRPFLERAARRIGNGKLLVRHFLSAIALFLNAHEKFALPPRKGAELNADNVIAVAATRVGIMRRGTSHARRPRLVIRVKLEIMILLGIVFLPDPEHERVLGRGERAAASAARAPCSWMLWSLYGWRRMVLAVFHRQQRHFAVIAERDDLRSPQPPYAAAAKPMIRIETTLQRSILIFIGPSILGAGFLFCRLGGELDEPAFMQRDGEVEIGDAGDVSQPIAVGGGGAAAGCARF